MTKNTAIQAILASPTLSKAASAETSSAADAYSSANDSSRLYKVVDSVYAKVEAACRSGNVRELDKILRRRPDVIDMVFPGGWNCLHLCAQQGRVSCIETLLTSTALDCYKGNDKNGIAAMHIAAKFNHLPVIKLLIGDFKVDANHRTFKGRTPLHFAVLHGDKALCAYLLANKADHYAQDTKGVTALIAAASRGNGDILSLLIQYGADLSVQDVRGRTALHVAYYKGHFTLTTMLIKAGADQTIKNQRNETPRESTRQGSARSMPAASGGGKGGGGARAGGISSRVSTAATKKSTIIVANNAQAPSTLPHFKSSAIKDEDSDDEFDGWADAGLLSGDDTDDDEEAESPPVYKKRNNEYTV